MTHQTTIHKSVSCTGIGLHRGVEVLMRLLPAPANTGVVFRRTDLSDRKHATVPARYDLVVDTRLGTTLKNEHGVSVATVEHLMAALWGAGVDNVIVELDGPEVPIMDGSSEPFLVLLKQAGLRRLAEPRRIIRVLREVEVVEGESVGRVAAYEGEDEGCSLDIAIDYKHPVVKSQRSLYDFGDVTFGEALSRARTFGFAHEVEAMRKAGLALGGSLDNAIVVGQDGVLNDEGLRFPDEFIRHKALDCIGDLFLAGYRIEGAFNFVRPGHGINNKLLRALMADQSAWVLVGTASSSVVAHAEPAVAYL